MPVGDYYALDPTCDPLLWERQGAPFDIRANVYRPLQLVSHLLTLAALRVPLVHCDALAAGHALGRALPTAATALLTQRDSLRFSVKHALAVVFVLLFALLASSAALWTAPVLAAALTVQLGRAAWSSSVSVTATATAGRRRPRRGRCASRDTHAVSTLEWHLREEAADFVWCGAARRPGMGVSAARDAQSEMQCLSWCPSDVGAKTAGLIDQRSKEEKASTSYPTLDETVATKMLHTYCMQQRRSAPWCRVQIYCRAGRTWATASQTFRATLQAHRLVSTRV